MTNQIIIRDAKKGDQSAIAQMMLGLNRFEHKISPNRNIEIDAGIKHLEYAQDLIADKGGFVMVATDGDSYAGFVIGIVAEEEGHYIDPNERNFGDLHDLFIYEAYRGQGLATQLLDQAGDRFRALGITRMDLYVLAENKKAVSLYEGQGFKVHEYCMSKPL